MVLAVRKFIPAMAAALAYILNYCLDGIMFLEDEAQQMEFLLLSYLVVFVALLSS